MTYQRFSVALVSVVDSVITSSALARLSQQADRALEDRVEHGDVEPHDEADREDQHRQVARLLPGRPGDLLQLGPRLVDEASDATHVCCSSFRLRLPRRPPTPGRSAGG